MQDIKVNAVLVERVGKESGKPYKCIEIQLTDKYIKKVFLEPAEIELLSLTNKENGNQDPFSFE